MSRDAIEDAVLDPQSVFATPGDVVAAEGLAVEDKLRILRQWEVDARELLVATEENMGGGEDPRLDDIRAAIRRVKASAARS